MRLRSRRSCPPRSSDALLRGEIEHAGRQRSYLFYAPAGEGPFTLLVALHGRLGDGKGQERLSGLVLMALTLACRIPEKLAGAAAVRDFSAVAVPLAASSMNA